VSAVESHNHADDAYVERFDTRQQLAARMSAQQLEAVSTRSSTRVLVRNFLRSDQCPNIAVKLLGYLVHELQLSVHAS
jgi:hypothetical protein